MKTGETLPKKASVAKISAAKPPAALPWLERPTFDMALRIGTAALMAIAASLVLVHLTVYSLSVTSQDLSRTPSPGCSFARC